MKKIDNESTNFYIYIDTIESTRYAGRWHSADTSKSARLVECNWAEDERILFCVRSPSRSFSKYKIFGENLECVKDTDEGTCFGTYDGLETITWNGGHHWRKQKSELQKVYAK